MLWAWLLPVAVVKLHDGHLHAVDWGEGPWAFVTPVKAIRVGVGLFKKNIECFSGIQTQIAGIKGNHADHLTTTTTLIWAVFKLLNSLWEYFCFKITLFSHFWARWLIRTNYFLFFKKIGNLYLIQTSFITSIIVLLSAPVCMGAN